jgi:hypothetical protein
MTGLRQKRFNIGDRRNSAVSEKSRAEKREEKRRFGTAKTGGANLQYERRVNPY